jgi:hypothetical protein
MLRPGGMVVLVLLVVLLLIPGGIASAATVHLHKPAWQWSLDERLAARFDPAAQAARQAAHRDIIVNLHLDGPADVVDGKETPELYLPTELFNQLLNVAFFDLDFLGPERRHGIEARAVALGFKSDLWPRLESAVSPYLKLRRTPYTLFGGQATLGGKGLLGQPSRELSLCHLQSDALAAAKAGFGERAFLRLLYEAVAPTTRLSYTINSISRAQARFVEQGCPAPRAS